MNNINLLWNQIKSSGNAAIEFIRISADSILELNIGINSLKNRCLILELPKAYSSNYQTVIKQNLSLHVLREDGYIILELMDNTYYDLFDDLILSLYMHVYNIAEIEKCEKILIATFHKWLDFFEDKKSELLSQEIIKGLFGELFILQSLIEDSSSVLLFDDILKSWRGPYDVGHDFVRDKVDIEVKTKEITKQSVHISSEYQLFENEGKGLELLVLSVRSDTENGKSIRDLVFEIKENLYVGTSDYTILLNALAQKGITILNIDSYDNFKYVPIDSKSYNCCEDMFPRFIKENIHRSQINVRYNLIVSEIEEFMIDHKKHT